MQPETDPPPAPRESQTPIKGAARSGRHRLGLKQELLLATLPTVIVLLVLWFLEALSNQRVLFASLASSAFLIYLDPSHGTNSIRTLVSAQLLATAAGLLSYVLLDHTYVAAGLALVVTILAMVLLDVVHPPAIGTSLAFAFREGEERTLSLFLLALAVLATLVVLERSTLWLLIRLQGGGSSHGSAPRN